MATSTRPALSAQYFGAQANQLFNNTGSRPQSVADRIQQALNTIGNAFRAASYGLRQEVPFERWFYDHGFTTPITSVADEFRARAWAFVAACEGAVRIVAETAAYIFSLVFDPQESHHHLDVLKAQMRGFGLSLLAILSPNDAKERAYNQGSSLIGCSLLNWQWGSLYTGTVDAPFWHVECRHYPWIGRPTP